MRRYVLLAFSWVVAACSSTPPAPAPRPAPVPLAAVLDSAALHERLTAEPEGAAALFEVDYAPEGSVREVRAVQSPSTAERIQLQRLLSEHLKPRANGDTVASRMILVRAGPVARIEVLPGIVEAAPVLNNQRSIASQAQQLRVSKSSDAPLRAVLKIRVHADGSPGEVQLQRSSGRADLDAHAVRLAREMRFRPGVVDGHPVDLWAVIPLDF